jgi:hypothetical protein
MPARTWATLERGLLEMSSNKAATEALDAIQLTGFVALDDKPLTTARKAFEEAAR